MIVPDKKTESYLNRKACVKDIVHLCRSGILSPVDYLRAAVLCRSENKWKRDGRFILFRLAGLGFLAAAFFFVIDQWHFFYTPYGGVSLAILFVVCAFVRRFAIADYAGAGLIAAMIFLSDLIFGTTAFLYEQLFLWFFLSVFWTWSSSRTGVRLLSLIILNLAVALYGWQYVLPTRRLAADSFCALAALLNLILLVLREELALRKQQFRAPAFRFALLLFAAVFLLTGVAAQSFLNEGDRAFYYCFLFTIVSGGFYLIVRFDLQALRFLLVFGVLWISLLICRGVDVLMFPDPQRQAFFLSLESVLIISAFMIDCRFCVYLKDKQNVD